MKGGDGVVKAPAVSERGRKLVIPSRTNYFRIGKSRQNPERGGE